MHLITRTYQFSWLRVFPIAPVGRLFFLKHKEAKCITQLLVHNAYPQHLVTALVEQNTTIEDLCYATTFVCYAPVIVSRFGRAAVRAPDFHILER